MNPAIPGAAQRIQEEPQKKLEQMRPREGRDRVPDDRAGCLSAGVRRPTKSQTFDALGIKMDFAMFFAGETFEQFGKSALRAMAAVHER